MGERQTSDVRSADETDREETKHSPAGFEAPEPELENGEVICAGCGEIATAEEMGVTADRTISADDGAVIEVTRSYVHNDEDCMMELLESGDL